MMQKNQNDLLIPKKSKKKFWPKIGLKPFWGRSTKDLHVEGVPALSFMINKTEEKI